METNMENTNINFPEYGKQCEIFVPFRGYERGTIIEETERGLMVELSSGALIELPRDEIKID